MFTSLKNFLLFNKTPGQTVAKNTVWLVIGKMGGRLLRTILVIYAARILGAANWGVFSYVANLAGIFAVLTDFGISSLITREYARSETSEENKKIISTAFFLKLLFLIPAIIFLVVIAPHFSIASNMSPLLIFFAIILVFDSIRQLGFSVIKAKQQMEIQAGLYALTNVIIVVSGLLLLYYYRSVASLAYAYTIGSVIGCISTVYFLRSYIGNLRFGFQRKLAKNIIKMAWPFAVSGLLGSIMISTDIFIIGFFRSAQEVGFYSAADKTIQLLYAPSLILATSSFPIIARLAQRESQKMSVIFKRLVHVILILLIPITLGGVIIAPELIRLAFGNGYIGAVLPLQILLLTLSFRFISVLLINVTFAYNKQKTLVVYTAASIILNIICNLLLIPKFGLAGSAIATLLVNVLGSIYMWVKVKNMNSTIEFPSSSKIILASITMLLFAIYISKFETNLLIIISLCTVAYCIFLYLFKEPLFRQILDTIKAKFFYETKS